MQHRCISAIGGYLPLLRLDRKAAAKALGFAGLGGRGAGYRAVAGWDEDPVTMAVEATRSLHPAKRLVFASTSAPFYDRLHATLAASALHFPVSTRTVDVSGSRRCATSALLDALLGSETSIVAAAEKRPVQAGSAIHAGWGDGAAAVAVAGEGGARLIGHATRNHDLLDVYSSRDRPTPYAAEERFMKEAAAELISATVAEACRSADISPDRIKRVAAHEALAGTWSTVARRLGIVAPNASETVERRAGDIGAAHGIYSLAVALADADPGDVVLLVGFGSGCDALLFVVDGPVPGAAESVAMLDEGLVLLDYVRFLSLTGTLELDFGVRSEFEQKAQASVIERHGRDTIAFLGGRDSAGNVQFPKSSIPVRPGATGPEPMSDVRLADMPASLISVTADRLNYTPDPPFWFGLVQFEGGARVLMELTDADEKGFAVGDQLRMRMRIKSYDRRRGMRTYFWKAAPMVRPVLGD